MNSVKTIVVAVILAVVGLGLYLRINSLPEPEPPEEFTGTYGTPPQIELGGSGDGFGDDLPAMPLVSQGNTPPGGSAPAFTGGGSGTTGGSDTRAGGSAPPFESAPSQPPGGTAQQHAPGGHESVPIEPTVNPLAGPAVQDPTAQAAVEPQFGPEGGAPSVEIPQGPPADDTERHQYGAPPSQTAAAAGEPPAEIPLASVRHATFDEAWREAQQLLAAGELAEAHLLLSAWYGNPTLLAVEQRELLQVLSGLAGTVIYSTENHLLPPYPVRPGETLEQIARDYEVPVELLAKINGLQPDAPLRPGASIKVVRGPFSAFVDVQRKEMVLVLEGRYAGRFPVSIGSDRADAAGVYHITGKQANPTYHGPDRSIGPDDPNNPLGELMLSLKKSLANAAELPFGIHGVSDPAAVARDEGPGYIRLTPRDVEDAAAILSVGSRVIIRR